MQGQAHNIEDLGALNVNRAGLGDDLINEFYNWRKRAFKAEGNPYFKKWGSEKKKGTGTCTKVCTLAMGKPGNPQG